MKNLNLFLVAFVFVFMNTLSAFAGPNRTTYQAKIVKPDGYPLESSNVNFKFTILDPAGNCILYSETYSSVNMSSTGGLISFSLGSGVKTYPVSATTFEQVFSNITPSLSCDTGGPTDYTPAASDTRKIVMQFHDGNGWQTLPAMSINAVPYAMFANDAQKLNGKTDTDFVQVTAMPTCTTDEALYYNGTSFTCVSTATVSAAAVVSALGYTPADGASVTALTSSLSTTDATVSSVSSTVASVSSTVFSVSATVSGLSASMAAITSSQWASSGSTISYNSGFVGVGTTTPVTKLDVSGGLRIGVESATCAAGLAGTIRYNSGNVEFCNGTSWSAFGVAGAGITLLNGSASGSQIFATGVTGTVFNISSVNGVHTFNIPLAASSSVTAGLLSNSDYATFANKLNATSAAVISALGYTPANDANNLSDLASATVARANLGLGTLAILNFIDLSSSQASGTLAAAKLPAFSGDVSSSVGTSVLTLANVGSGVTSGTEYAKVTVDGKGRVTSGAQLSVSDVTTALGYTPASASASTQWVTSGTTISYSTGNVGIGTSNPISRLTITDGQVVSASLSTTDYALFAAQNTAPTFSIVTADSASSPTSRSVFKGVRARGTLSSPLPPQVDDHVLSFLGSIYDGSSTQGSAMVSFLVDGAVSPGVAPQRISFFTSLAGAASRTEKLTIKSDGKIGIGTTTPVTRLEVSGGVKISMESATCAVSYAGTLRYNTGNVEYCNGTIWSAFGVSGAGLQSFNGSTSGTQSFANGTTGTAPLFATANGVHTLNIPLASAGSVTAGLISNADYASFSNKITSSAVSIAQVLGYVPASATALGNYLVRTNNLSDLTSSASARTNLGLGTFATANTIDLGSASATGTLAVARLPSFNGDATIAAASNTIILSNSGVTAGTYTKLTVDNKGRVTSSSALASSDVTTALGYTPASASASTQWATSGTTINYMTGNVGIGTTTPVTPLDVAGTIRSAIASDGNFLTLQRTSQRIHSVQGVGQLLKFTSDSANTYDFQLDASNRNIYMATGGGNVGIGTSSPGSALSIKSSTANNTTGDGFTNLRLEYAGGYNAGDMGAGVTFAQQYVAPGTDAATIRVGGIFGVKNQAAGNFGGGLAFFRQPAGAANMSEAMRIDQNGNVGIGTTAPLGNLDVIGTQIVRASSSTDQLNFAPQSVAGDGAKIYVVNSAQNAYRPLEIEGSTIALTKGNVGIGTSAPSAKLHLAAGTASTAPLKFTSGTLLSSPQSGTMEFDGSAFYLTDGAGNRRVIAAGANPSTIDDASYINSTGNITMTPVGSVVVSSTTASTNSSTGALIVAGGAGIAGNLNVSGTISSNSGINLNNSNDFILRAAASTPNDPGDIVWRNSDASERARIYSGTASSPVINFSVGSSPSTKMTILENGNVGIGTTDPRQSLEVLKNTVGGLGGRISIANNATSTLGNEATVDFDVDGNAPDSTPNAQISGILTNVTNFASDIKFSTYNGSSLGERMRVTSTGNVGIGTTSPAQLFDVAGSAAVNNLFIGSTRTYGGYGAPDDPSVDTKGKIVFGSNTNDSAAIYSEVGAGAVTGLIFEIKDDADDYIQFKNQSSALMTVLQSGNVGIGTTTPDAKVRVIGKIKVGTETDNTSANLLPQFNDVFELVSQNTTSAPAIAFHHRGLHTLQLGSWGSSVTEQGLLLKSGSGEAAAQLNVQSHITSKGGNLHTYRGRLAFSNTPTDSNHTIYNNLSNLDGEGSWDGMKMNVFDGLSIRVGQSASAVPTTALHINGSGNVGIGTISPTKTLQVSGSILAGGLVSEQFTFPVDGTSNGTFAIGSLTNDGKTTHVKFSMSVHNNSVIDALTFQVSLPSYSNGTFYPNWQELPVGFGSSAWNGQKNYVIDVLRSSVASGNPFYFRVRNKNGNGSASTMMIRMEYSSEAIFTRLTSSSTVGTAFNAGSAPAGGAVDGMYGALEYSFPIAIGQAWRPADNSGLFIKNSGYVGIGTSSPSEMLEVSGSVKAVSYLYTSDRRLKKDIITLPDALAKVLQLRGVNFVWKNNEEKTVGFIAQEVEAVYPELVKTDKNSGLKAVQYGNIVAILVEALKQEHQERTIASDKSDARFNQLEKENQELKARLEKLEKFLNEKVK